MMTISSCSHKQIMRAPLATPMMINPAKPARPIRNGNTTSYTYVGDTGNIASITYPNGTTETYTYNDNYQVTGITQKDGTA